MQGRTYSAESAENAAFGAILPEKYSTMKGKIVIE